MNMRKESKDEPQNHNEITKRLHTLLGTGSRTGWINFMDETMKLLPFLSIKGRPPKAALQSSVIGLSGYKTWKAYLEAELTWNRHTWDAWRRAYKLVLKYPYLRELKLSASKINSRYKLNPKSFPVSTEQWESEPIKSLEQKKESDGLSATMVSIDSAYVEALEIKVSRLTQENGGLQEKLLLIEESEKGYKFRQEIFKDNEKLYQTLEGRNKKIYALEAEIENLKLQIRQYSKAA